MKQIWIPGSIAYHNLFNIPNLRILLTPIPQIFVWQNSSTRKEHNAKLTE